MSKLPICINIDDHTPLVHVYCEHSRGGKTNSGLELADGVPLSFFRRFCDIIDEKYINAVADKYITEDGGSGKIIDTMNENIPVIILTHWQSLFSNGKGTGLSILDTVCRRVGKHLSNKLEWTPFSAFTK